MKKSLLVALVAIALLVSLLLSRRSDQVPPASGLDGGSVPLVQDGKAPVPAQAGNPATASQINTTAASTPAISSTAQDATPNWPRIIAFNAWAKDFAAAAPETRATMTAEGLRLAQERRQEFKKLIVADPERALEQAVRPVLRQDLPAEILAELEQPVSTRGDFRVYRGRPEPGKELPDSELVLRYVATSSGETYRAHVFGDVKVLPYQKDVALRGVSLDREMAVANSALRQLDRGERIPAGVTVSDVCPVSGNVTPVNDAAGQPVTDETPTVELAGEIIRLCDGSQVTVLDERSRLTANIAASGGPGGAHPIKDNFPGTSSEAIGNFRTLYIRCAYPDRLQAPNTEASAQEDMANVGRFYVESSYGRLSVSTVVTPLVVLPHTREYYEDKDTIVDGLGLLHSDARREARLLGFDSGAFNVVIMRINGGLRSGASWGGGDSVWAGWDGMDVLNHECGHSLGRPHANFWNTGGQSAIGAGANQEYGNSFDVMGGGGGFSAHYNTISKRALRWLPEQNIHSPTASGIYRVYAYDQPLLEEGKRYAVKVRKDVTRNYYLEYHNSYGIEHPSRVELRNSALVIWSGFGSAGHLIDTTPGTPGGKDDSGIEVGRTFSDEGAGVHFTVVARNATSPESLDIAVNLGNDAANHAPTLTLTPSALTVASGGSLTFTANATDADGDALAYHWDFGDGLPSVNTATFTRSFNAARQHTVHCTVSDMKGGVTRRHVVVTVGSPGRQTVTGQVLANGQPLQGVILTGGGKYAYTDAGGNFALSDLGTGALAVTPLLHGYSFTPNPGNITVVAGANVLNFTATPITQVSIAATADAAETGANGNFRITRSGNTTAAMDVRVMAASGSAVRGVDYSLSPDYTDDGNYRTFNFPAGVATLDISVVASNDAGSEGPETVTLQLAEGTNYIASASGIATVKLTDDDTTLPQVSIAAAQTEVSETPGAVSSFIVKRLGSTVGNLDVSLGFGGTAARGADYPGLPSTVTIPDGQESLTVLLAPLDDALIEGTENATVSVLSGSGYVLSPDGTSVDFLLLDDDIATVTVSALDPDASEASREPGVFLISRSGPTTAPLKVYYGLGGTASHGTDYIQLPAEVTIPAGAASAPAFITPYDDAHGEAPESVNIHLAVFDGAYLVGAPAAATVRISDNDDLPLLTVASMSSTTSEPSDAGALRFRIEGNRATPTTVRYTVSGTATPGADYTALPGTLVMPPTTNSFSQVEIALTVLNDALKENVETIVVTLTPDPAYVIYNDEGTTILLRDDDQPLVSVSTSEDSPAEGTANSASFYISRSGATFTDVTVGAMTVDYALTGTAANGVDYTLLPGSVIIPDGAPGVDIAVAAIDDALLEGTETVTLTLLPSASYGVAVASTTLYLVDNEAHTVSAGFLVTSNSTFEAPDGVTGEFRLVPVTLTPASAEEVTVEYIVSSGSTAWANGIDWNLADDANGDALIQMGVLRFAPGVTTQNIKVRIVPDSLIEGTEIAAIELRNAWHARVSSSRGKQLLYINDSATAHPAARFSFVTAGSTVGEGSATAPLVIVALDRPATAATRVSYAVTGGTASPGSDFTLASGLLDFAAGETMKLLPLALLNDTDAESDETVLITLSNPLGGQLGAASVHTLTIRDNDSGTPTVSVVASDATGTEGGDGAAFTITRTSGGATGALSVRYTVAGTATPGADYVALSGTAVIADGESSAVVLVTSLNDAALESTETVSLTIIPDAAYRLGAPITAAVSLADDEAGRQPPLALAQSLFVPRNQPSAIRLSGIDPNGDVLTFQVVTNPTRGTLSGTAPNLTYTPQVNYTGADSLSFRVTDGANTSAVATVSLTVYNAALVASNSTWRFNDAGIDLGTGWTALNASETGWGTGSARLGFGDAATTTLRGQPVITYYFRQKFVVPEGITFTNLTLRMQRDDGMIAFLNANEAARENMPPGAATYSTRATASVGGADETAWFTYNVNPGLLVPGTNIIAVELHQVDAGSSDAGFAAELIGYGVPAAAGGAVVTVVAQAPQATEGAGAAVFVVSRQAADVSTPLTVSYTLSGDATPGVDYPTPSGSVEIAAGATQASISLAASNDFEIESTETLTLTLASGLGYSLGVNLSASVELLDDDGSRVPPAALAQSVSVLWNQPSDITLAGSDAENDPLNFQIVTQPANGSLAGTPPNVIYTPLPGYSGADAFSFRVNDGGLWSAPAVVSVTVVNPALLIAENAMWKYNDLGNDLGSSWRTTNYNDGAWAAGPARLGFGGDGELTTLRGQPVITYYFRKTVVLAPGWTPTNVIIRVQRDDGVVVYVNGSEVARDNMPAGAPAYATRSVGSVADEQEWLALPLASSVLRPGTNVIAAEVHQQNSTSSDAGFHLTLRADGYFASGSAPAPRLVVTTPGAGQVRIAFPAANGLRYAVDASEDLVNWQPVTTNVVTAGAFQYNTGTANPPARFYRARQVQ